MYKRRDRRILVVTRNLPPLLGGMERLNWNMIRQLGLCSDVRVVGPSGAAASAPDGITVVEARTNPLPRFLATACWHVVREARRFKPNIVLAGSGLMAPHARMAAAVCDATAVAYVHGLDIVVESPLYRCLWLPSIRAMDRIIANSHATAELCRGIGISPARIGIVHPGVEVPTDWLGAAGPEFRAKHQLGSRPLLLSVGRLTARKGLLEFVQHVLPRIVSSHPGVMLLVIGGPPNQALHAKSQTREEILAAAVTVCVDSNIRFLGTLTDDELHAAWQAADVHVFPVRAIQGDPEGFGMVAIEAAAMGVPTVAFGIGGVVSAVKDGTSGYVVAENDRIGFADRVIDLLSAPLPGETIREFASEFDWREFGRSIMAEIDEAK